MPERIPKLAESDDISPIVGKMLPAAFMIDWDGGGGEGGRGKDDGDDDAEIVLDLRPQITEHEKPLEFLYF